MAPYNPFYGIDKADVLPLGLAAKLFVAEASPIWADMQAPINNLIVGPRGTGKTMALRQLGHGLGEPRPANFIGLYIQISRISTIFQHVFDNEDLSSADIIHLQRIFGDHFWLAIMRELVQYLKAAQDRSMHVFDNEFIQELTDQAIQAPSIESLDVECANRQQRIEQTVHRWSTGLETNWKPMVDLSASLEKTCTALRNAIPYLDQDHPCIYLLLDESSPIPEACQQVVNGLLHRGRPYCVKLAVRPYEWTILETTAHRAIEPGTDIKPLYVRHPNELQDAYVQNMRTLINRVLRIRLSEVNIAPESGWTSVGDVPDISSILLEDSNNYSGFLSVCASSSGNPQNLLEICSCIVATAISDASHRGQPSETLDLGKISAETQNRAVVRWSRDYEDQNPYPVSKKFCRALLNIMRSSNHPEPSIGFQYQHSDQAQIFSTDYLPEPIGKLVKPAFSGGFLQSEDPDNTSLFEVPSSFNLNRGLLARERFSLSSPKQPVNKLDRDFVMKHTSEGVPMSRSNPPNHPLTAFLSTAFGPTTAQQRTDIKNALAKVSIKCIDVEDAAADQFLFTAIHKGIKNTDFTILDATVLRPYTMFEMGLCAGAMKPKHVICVINEHETSSALNNLPEYIRKLPILRFNFEEEQLSNLAETIRDRARGLLAKPSEFKKVVQTGMPLRPKRRDRALFLSLPQSSIRDRAIDAVRKELENHGWSVIVEQDLGTYGPGPNELQVPIYCAYLSRVGIVHITREDGGLDLLQCYKLGLFAGKRRPWRVLRVGRGPELASDAFASGPNIAYRHWNSIDDLVSVALEFVGSEGGT